MIVTVVVLAVLAAALGWLYLHTRAKQQRMFAERQAAAAQLGLVPAPVPVRLEEVAARIFQAQGNAERLVTGQATAFDYTYSTTRTSTAAKCHVITYELPAALPPIAVLRKNPMLPGQEFESEQFNKLFSVECADSRYASAMMNPQMMVWLVDGYPSFQWRIEGRLLITWGVGYWNVPTVTNAIRAFQGIVERIPPFVLRDYGAH
ncbi:hypothetical protein ACI2LF_23310 [Kribbella sp. NPDC020789]